MASKRGRKHRTWVWALQRATYYLLDRTGGAQEHEEVLFRIWCNAVTRSLHDQRTPLARHLREAWQRGNIVERKGMRIDGRTFGEFCSYAEFAVTRFSRLMNGELPLLGGSRKPPRRADASPSPGPGGESRLARALGGR